MSALKRNVFYFLVITLLLPSLSQIIHSLHKKHIFCEIHSKIEHLDDHEKPSRSIESSATDRELITSQNLKDINFHEPCLLLGQFTEIKKFLVEQSIQLARVVDSWSIIYIKSFAILKSVIGFAPKNSPPLA